MKKYTLYLQNILLACVLLLLVSCSAVQIDRSAVNNEISKTQNELGFKQENISTSTFTLYALLRPASGENDTLHVYIEGDGLAWITRNRPSTNPTPTQSTALYVAQKDPSFGPVLYLARPCQYVDLEKQSMCERKFWMGHRFAPEVITATDEAISHVKAATKAQRVVLIGYSGGGAVASLVAARRNDVAFLGSFAGNLDVDGWTNWHKVTPLDGSLKPMNVLPRIANLPQRHIFSQDDKIIPPEVNTNFCKALARPEYCQRITGIGHGGDWSSVWNYNYN